MFPIRLWAMSHKINKTNKLKNSELEIEAELAYEAVAAKRNEAIAQIQKGLNLPGFRVGHVPENIIVSKIGELAIIEEAAEMALQGAVATIIEEGKYQYLGQPQVSITKIAIDSPVEFKVRLILLPEIKLCDYQKTASGWNAKRSASFEATEQEIEDGILKIRQTYAQHFHTHAEGEEHKEGEELPLPELNEELLKKLGDFKDIEDFKVKVKETILKEKELREKEKNRLAIIEDIIKNSEIELPQVLIEIELDKMQAQFQDDISRYGMKTEDYLKHLGKKLEDLRKEWTTDAEKRAKLQLILNKIADTEKIEPEAEKMEAEIKNLLAYYKEAKEDRVRAYVLMTMTNEKVFEWLENQK